MVADTYFYLLEQAKVHEMRACCGHYEHMTAQFDRSVYEANAARSFSCHAEAYEHWVRLGRSKGLAFADSCDTLLKVILKCKDDTEYIQSWIEYHACLVGYHNIVVVDCGSTDLQYWEVLNKYLGRVLVLSYSKYYDYIHSVVLNRRFYDLIACNTKYLVLMDTDEFLFGVSEGRASAHDAKVHLAATTTSLIAGTWFNNMSKLSDEACTFSIDDELDYAADRNWITWGSIAGKSIVASDCLGIAGNIGHNLHLKAVIKLFSAKSFGKLGILHVNPLSDRVEKKRALRHLRSKGLVAVDLVNESEISKALSLTLQASSVSPIERLYIGRYLANEASGPPTTKRFRLSLSQLMGQGVPLDQNWADFQTFDFAQLLRQRQTELAAEADGL